METMEAAGSSACPVPQPPIANTRQHTNHDGWWMYRQLPAHIRSTPHRAPVPNNTTRTVRSRITRSSASEWFFK